MLLISPVIVLLYRVRVWDVIILCPNAIFLLYLAIKMRIAVKKLHRSSSPVLTTFFLLVTLLPVHSFNNNIGEVVWSLTINKINNDWSLSSCREFLQCVNNSNNNISTNNDTNSSSTAVVIILIIMQWHKCYFIDVGLYIEHYHFSAAVSLWRIWDVFSN